jgi:GNAT superfamily N-acetyltransferase
MADAPLACEIRAATADDLLAVVRVQAQSRPSSAPLPEQTTDRQRAAWGRMMATDDLTVFVAEVEGEAVGTACLLLMPNLGYECRPSAFIEAVVVARAHRRRGIARAMIERILADARAAGCRKVQLLSHKRHADDGAHALYRSVGFEPEAEGFRVYLEP